MSNFQTFGRVSKYESGTSISDNEMLLMAIAAFNIWFVHLRVWFNCFLELSLRPPVGTRGTGSHHFSSWRCTVFRKETDPSASGAIMPWSTYQNSVLVKLSNISCHGKAQLIVLNKNFYPKLRQTRIIKQALLVLTRSMLSSLRRAGRLMKISALGLQVMTYENMEETVKRQETLNRVPSDLEICSLIVEFHS